MIRQSPARIYKADQHGLYENQKQRWYATFNFEFYNDPSRTPFGPLQVLNEETLGPQQQISRTALNGCVLLIPLVGTLEYKYEGETAFAETNEAVWLPLNGELLLKNPYEEELINFLYIAFSHNAVTEPTTLNINLSTRNTLAPFSLPGSIKAKMGLFDGRGETIYKLQNENNGVFVYVIAGAFEVEGRLLETHDGLALWQLQETDMEALSENAVLLLFELPVRG